MKNNSFLVAKKSLAIFAGALSFAAATSVYAATVTITTPDGTDGSSYTVEGDETVYDVFNNIESGDGLASAAANGGHEFILLGAHETVFHSSDSDAGFVGRCTVTGDTSLPVCNDTLDVNVTNSGGGAATGAVSLLLSASESVLWNLNVDSGVDLQGVYIFGSQPQTVQINGGAVIAADLMGAIGAPDVLFSQDMVCAYEYPNSTGGCDTAGLLGLFPLSFDNFLGDFFDDKGIDSLQVTNFNGSEFVDQFDVAVTTSVTAIPLPGALLLFASALGGLFSIRPRFQ